jgi:hemerythrin-like domain-containing protein
VSIFHGSKRSDAAIFAASRYCALRCKQKNRRYGKHQDNMAGLTLLGEVLHEEHFRILASICELQNRVTDEAGDRFPDPHNDQERQELHELIGFLDQVLDHDAFEEDVVFPLIRAGGKSDLAGFFTGEHGTIEPITKRLRLITTKILRDGPGPGTGRCIEFRKVGKQLVSEMISHLEKEELSILQRLDSLLDAETDHHLAFQHIAARLLPASALRTSNLR